MNDSSPSIPRRKARRHLRRLTAALATAAVAALATGGALSASAAADTPTAPPPVTVLTHGSNLGKGDFSVSPFGGTAPYANGPEILDQNGNVVWFHPIPAGQEASDFRTQTYNGQPVLTWWQGTGFGGLGQRTHSIYKHHEHGRPHLARRPRQPDRDRRRRPGNQHQDRQGPLAVEQRRPRAVQPVRAAAAHDEHGRTGPELPVGLVPHQRGEARQRRQPADRRP